MSGLYSSVREVLHAAPDTETTSTRKVNCVFITTEREYRGEEQSHEGVLKSGRSSCQVISLSGTCPAKILSSLPLSLCVYRTWSVARFIPFYCHPKQQTVPPLSPGREARGRAAGVRDVCGPERWLGKKQKQLRFEPHAKSSAGGWLAGRRQHIHAKAHDRRGYRPRVVRLAAARGVGTAGRVRAVAGGGDGEAPHPRGHL